MIAYDHQEGMRHSAADSGLQKEAINMFVSRVRWLDTAAGGNSDATVMGAVLQTAVQTLAK